MPLPRQKDKLILEGRPNRAALTFRRRGRLVGGGLGRLAIPAPHLQARYNLLIRWSGTATTTR